MICLSLNTGHNDLSQPKHRLQWSFSLNIGGLHTIFFNLNTGPNELSLSKYRL